MVNFIYNDRLGGAHLVLIHPSTTPHRPNPLSFPDNQANWYRPDDLEIDFPFQTGDFQVPAVSFSGEQASTCSSREVAIRGFFLANSSP